MPALSFDPERLDALGAEFARWEFGSLSRRLADLAADTSGQAGMAAAPAAPIAVTECVPDELALRLAGLARIGLAVADSRWAIAAPDGTVFAGTWTTMPRRPSWPA